MQYGCDCDRLAIRPSWCWQRAPGTRPRKSFRGPLGRLVCAYSGGLLVAEARIVHEEARQVVAGGSTRGPDHHCIREVPR